MIICFCSSELTGASFSSRCAPCHTAQVGESWLHENQIKCIDWPGYSPDLNPIENLWSIMKGRLAKEPSKNRNELIIRLKNMWVKELSKDLFVKLAKSLPRRIKMVLDANGGHTKY